MSLLILLIIGLVAGSLAKSILGQTLTFGQTLLVGIIGSFVGGTLTNLVFGHGLDISSSGLIGSTIGAIITLYGWNRYKSQL